MSFTNVFLVLLLLLNYLPPLASSTTCSPGFVFTPGVGCTGLCNFYQSTGCFDPAVVENKIFSCCRSCNIIIRPLNGCCEFSLMEFFYFLFVFPFTVLPLLFWVKIVSETHKPNTLNPLI